MDDEKLSRSGSFKKRPRNQFDNGKRKRRNPYPSHDQSSVSSKPVDTLYRILCPVKKIGSVLGKGGDIVNALRNETHAKIRVADPIPGAEERVIIIFNHPVKEDNTEDDDVDGNDNDNTKIHCPAQDALLKVHDRIAADEYLRGGIIHERTDPDEDATVRILVPDNQVGCLIGKAGTVIQKLRSDYPGATIRIMSKEHLPPCAMSTDELVQISGAQAIVKKALYDISTRLYQHPRKENPSIDELMYASTRGLLPPWATMPPSQGRPMHPDPYGSPPPWYGGHKSEPYGYPPIPYNSGRHGNGEEAPVEFCLRILCPTGRIGGVIGMNGANVRQIEQHTRAKIQVEDTSPEAEERIINISSMEAPWDPISPTIEALLQLQVRTTASSEEFTITTRLLIPSSKVGCLLGERGTIINEMRKRIKADIRMYAKDDKPSYIPANQELVQISGSHEVAREALLEIASRLRTRTFRSGQPAPLFPDRGNPPPMFADRGFVPPEIMPGRGRPSPGMIGAAGNPPPAYHSHRFASPDNISSRGPPSSGMTRGGNAIGYEYSKGHGPPYETSSYHSGPPYESSSYRSGPPPFESSSYRAPPYETSNYPPERPPYEAASYRNPPPYEKSSYPSERPPYESTGYRTGPTYETQAFSGPPVASGYANMSGSMEAKPNVSHSGHSGAGFNIPNIRQNAPQPPPQQMYHSY